jgi:hypothetical protein
MAQIPDPYLGTVQINGERYRVDLASYRMKDITDFAPRASVAGGSVVHSELGLYQPYMKTDWRHGFGFIWETDEQGYLDTEGYIDTRHDGIVMLMSQINSSETTNAAKFGYRVFNGKFYTYGHGAGGQGAAGISGVMEYDGGSWTEFLGVGGADFGDVNYILPTKDYLFVFPDGGRVQKVATDDTATNAGVNASSTDYKWAVIHGGYVWAGKDNSGLVFRSSEADLSDLAGDIADDPDAVIVGGGRWKTLTAISWMGRLLVATREGLYEIGEDLKARKMLDFSGQESGANFRFLGVYNNRLVFPIRDSLFSWNGVTLQDITPRTISDQFPYRTYGRFINFAVTDRYMFTIGRTSDGTFEEHLLCYDGVGWHKLMEPVTNGSDDITALGYDSVNHYLWMHIRSASDITYYIKLRAQSEFPEADFATSGTHAVISSRIAMGFPRVTKSVSSIIIEAENVTADRYLIVYYALDSGGWVEWGGSGNGRIITDGVTELTNPTGHDGSSIEFNWMQVKVEFVTDSAAQSPVLEGFTLRFIMRPKTLWGHSFTIPMGTLQKMGAGRALTTGKQMRDALMLARKSGAPVKYVDPWGDEYKVYLSSVDIQIVEYHTRMQKGGDPDFEMVSNVNIAELG